LSSNFQKKSDGTWTIIGNVDELSDYSDILADNSKDLCLDLANLKNITSHGIRSWVRMIESIQNRNIQFVRCTAVFLDAIDMLPRILPKKSGTKSIKSLMISFHCDHCDKNLTKEIDRSAFVPGKLDAITAGVACPRCVLPVKCLDDVEMFSELLSQTS
jgi:hypothetical protein